MHAQPLHRLVLLGALDTLRDHLGTLIVGEAHHRLDQVLLDEVRVDAVDERNVELDEIGLEVRNGAQAGVPAPGVVDRKAIAAFAQGLQPLAKLRVVLDRRALGDLDDDALRVGHLVIELAELRIHEVVRIHIQEQELATR